jgi:hypothetical protein
VPNDIDFSAPADLYPAREPKRRASLHYVRFDTIAEAVRHAMEKTPAAQLNGTLIESEERRFQGSAISELYLSASYPLPRVKAEQ